MRRRTIALVAANVVLLIAYLWSANEHVNVVLSPAGRHYFIRVGGDTFVLPVQSRPGGVGTYEGTTAQYTVHPTGEVYTRGHDLLTAVGSFMRRFGPGPAFSSVRMIEPALPPGEAMANVGRGNMSTSAVGTTVIWPSSAPRPVGIEVDLLRPEGVQGVLFGLDGRGDGYLFQIRMDAHMPIDPGDSRSPVNGLLFRWNHRRGPSGAPIIRVSFHHPSTVEMAQRDLRIMLASVVVAWLLALGMLAAYLILTLVLPRHAGPRVGGSRFTRRLFNAIPLLLVELDLVLTAFISKEAYRIPHVVDSVAYLFQAKTLALGHFYVAAPRFPRFFSELFILVYHGHWFGKYPVGWPLILAIGVKLNVAWIVNPALGAAGLVLIYLLGRLLYDLKVATVALIFAACSPLFVVLSFTYMAHTSAIFCLCAFACLCLYALREIDAAGAVRRRDIAVLACAGFMLGFAFIIRQLDVFPFAAAVLLLGWNRQFWRHLGVILSGLLIGGVWPVAFLLFYNWRLTGSPLRNPYTLWWSFDHLGFGAYTGREVFTPAIGLWNTSFNLESLQAYLFGWPFYVALAFVVLPFLLGRANRTDAALAAGIAGIICAYVFYYGPGVAFQPRYYSSALPWFALLTARGVQELVRLPLAVTSARLPRPHVARVAPLALCVFLLVYDIGYFWPAAGQVYGNYGYLSTGAIDAVAREHIHHAIVFMVQQPPYPGQEWAWETYPAVFSSNSPLLNTDVIYARDRGSKDTLLMREYPGRSYYRLRQVPLRFVPKRVLHLHPRFMSVARYIEITRISHM